MTDSPLEFSLHWPERMLLLFFNNKTPQFPPKYYETPCSIILINNEPLCWMIFFFSFISLQRNPCSLVVTKRLCASVRPYKKCRTRVSRVSCVFQTASTMCPLLIKRLWTSRHLIGHKLSWFRPLAKCRKMQMCRKENRPHGNYCSNSRPCRKALRH